MRKCNLPFMANPDKECSPESCIWFYRCPKKDKPEKVVKKVG